MPAAGPEYSAIAHERGIGVTAFLTLDLLRSVIRGSYIMVLMEQEAFPRSLDFQPAAPAAFPCLLSVTRSARLTEVARARSG